MEERFVSNEAPGTLETVRSFVNTMEIDEGREDLGTPAALAEWLAAHGLLGRGERATKDDLPNAVALREALREVLLGHHGGYEIDPAALDTLDEAARRSRLELRFTPDGSARPEPAGSGVDGALGRLLAIVADAQAEGTWQRLKACPASDCRWAFYDRSRNRSAVWCNMAVCGNRAKVRSYRERHGSV